MHNVTPLHPDKPQKKLQRVGWLAELLDLTPNQTYDAIRKGDVPPDCIAKVGRRIRIMPDRIFAWLDSTNTTGCESGHDQNDRRKSG